MGLKKEKKLKQLDLRHRTINLNVYIEELLDIVSKHMMMTESELIRYILTKELEKMVKKIEKQKKAGELSDTNKGETDGKHQRNQRKRTGRNKKD